MFQEKNQRTVIAVFKLQHVRLITCTLIFLFYAFCPSHAPAASPNVLYKIQVKPHPTYTRLTFRLEKETEYSLTERSGKRLKITFPLTSSLQSTKLRTYSDSHIGSISFAERNNNAIVIIAMKGDSPGYRLMAPVQSNIVTLDIGPSMKGDGREPAHPGRGQIWSGTEKLIREFEPPLRPDVPFIPTDAATQLTWS